MDLVPAPGQGERQSADNISQTTGFGKWVHLGGNKKDIHLRLILRLHAKMQRLPQEMSD